MANFDAKDKQMNKVVGGIGYLMILFLVPLILRGNSRFARYCANQGLLLLLAALAGWIVFGILGWLPFLGGIFGWIRGIYNFLLGAVAIYYAYCAIAKGDAKEVPFIGSIQLIR